MICSICGKSFKTNHGLTLHLHQHDISKEEYYHKYIDSSDHKCKYCSKKAKFINLEKGYSDTCGSRKCGKLAERDTRIAKYGKFESEKSIVLGIKNKEKTMLVKYNVRHNWCNGKLRDAITGPRHGDMVKVWAELSETERAKRCENIKKSLAFSPEKKHEIGERIQEKLRPKRAEILEKIHETCIARYGSVSPLGSALVRNKIFSNRKVKNGGFLSKPEKKFSELLKNRCIPFVYDYVYNSKHWDFLVNNEILVEIDGEYNHGLLSDVDGKLVKGENDETRFLKAKDYKFLAIDSRRINEGINELFELIGISYSMWIERIIDSLPVDFPYYSYTSSRMELDYNHLCRYSYKTGQKIGYSIINNFHRSIFSANVKGHISPYLAWQDKDKLRECVENRFIYASNLSSISILRGFNVCKIAPKISVFNPSMAKHIIDTYLSEFPIIFDPMSGYSGRMLGACAAGKEYIGQDINPVTINESNKIKDFLGLKAKLSVKDIKNDNGTYSCLFTCPPYSDIENWSMPLENKTCDEWIDLIMSKYKCEKYVFVVNKTEKYHKNIVEIIENKSHFSNVSEYILVFYNYT